MNTARPLTKQATQIISNAMFRRAATLGYNDNMRIKLAIDAQKHYSNGSTAIDACSKAEFQNISCLVNDLDRVAA